jgi:murein DD-endopeptidase MepM/ murein hydrolase activator NlpD
VSLLSCLTASSAYSRIFMTRFAIPSQPSAAGWCFKFVAKLFVTALLLAGSAFSQANNAVTRKTGATQWTQFNCETGLQLRLTSSHPSQGSLELVEIRSYSTLRKVVGKWDGKEIPFWQVTDSGHQPVDLQRALIGIDLQQPAGSYDFAVSGEIAEGHAFTCVASLTVKEGRFATEKLNVAPQFVEPNPEQLARADEERKRLREIFATVTPERLWSGAFRLPLTGVSTGGNFGKRRVLNGEPSSPHSGVDFPAPAGTAVHATQGGRVVLAAPLYFSGNTVVIDHGLGVYTLYGHLSSFSVIAGDAVKAGELIGKVGATGRVTGPHLHWGLTVNAARVNSLDIVRLL